MSRGLLAHCDLVGYQWNWRLEAVAAANIRVTTQSVTSCFLSEWRHTRKGGQQGRSGGRRPALWEDLHSLDGGGRSGRLPGDAQLGVDIGEVPLDRPLAEVK